jgi:triacylglycerol lipase
MVAEVTTYCLKEIAPPYLQYDYFKYANQAAFQFRPQAQEFDLVNAWWLSEAAILSYLEKNSVAEKFAKVGLPEVVSFSGKSTQCYAASNNDFLILAFRGTEIWAEEGETDLLKIITAILADIITDAKIKLIPWEQGGYVHQGFRKALQEVWQDLASYLESKDTGRSFWFTGHSLGAALATLAWKRYGSLRTIPRLYTFGSPRVGDKEFGKGFENTYRFVNNNDIVTKVPPPVDYQHVGRLEHLRADGLLEEKGFEPDSLTFLNSGAGLKDLYSLLLKAISAPRLPGAGEGRGSDFTSLIPRAIDYFNTVVQKAVTEIRSGSGLQDVMRSGLAGLIPRAILDHIPVLYSRHIRKNIGA